jgi:hypothetical protein
MLTVAHDRTSDRLPARVGDRAGEHNTESVTVSFGGLTYLADPVAKGAAYEIYSSVPADGFMSNPRPDTSGVAAPAFRRFVHSTEVDIVRGKPPVPDDAAMCMPLSASMSWAEAHRLSQSYSAATSGRSSLHAMRDTVRIRRGTRMVKILSARQLAGALRGWLPQGFCHREFDVAHLRTPSDLAVLATDHTGDNQRAGQHDQDGSGAVFALRWRAVDESDFAPPYAIDGLKQADGIDQPGYAGLIAMSPHQRIGPPVLGTGFAPTNRHIIPEFVTADLGDLPLAAHAELIGFTDDGTEVLLYRYIAEQRAWGRLAGKQWRGLLHGIDGLAADQEYFPIPEAPTRIMGWHDGTPYEAVADPRANEFLVLAKVRALRHTVTAPARISPRATWRGVSCTIIRESDEWLRMRLTRPTPDGLEATGAVCVERGIYEAWAPLSEVRDRHNVAVAYAT